MKGSPFNSDRVRSPATLKIHGRTYLAKTKPNANTPIIWTKITFSPHFGT